MNFEEWKQLCRKAWEKVFDYLQKNSFAQIREEGIPSEIVIKTLI